jgi:hypothetical protein
MSQTVTATLNFDRFPDDLTLDAARRIILENSNADAVLVAQALLHLVADIEDLKGKVERKSG